MEIVGTFHALYCNRPHEFDYSAAPVSHLAVKPKPPNYCGFLMNDRKYVEEWKAKLRTLKEFLDVTYWELRNAFEDMAEAGRAYTSLRVSSALGNTLFDALVVSNIDRQWVDSIVACIEGKDIDELHTKSKDEE